MVKFWAGPNRLRGKMQMLPGAPIVAVDLAERCALAVRDLRGVTDPDDGANGLAFPGDVYLVLGLLARAMRDLAPVMDHLPIWLGAEAAGDRVECSDRPDARGEVADVIGAFAATLAAAQRPCQELAELLTSSQTLIRDLRQP